MVHGDLTVTATPIMSQCHSKKCSGFVIFLQGKFPPMLMAAVASIIGLFLPLNAVHAVLVICFVPGVI